MPAGVATDGWRENSPGGLSGQGPWAELWGCRGLIGYLALRDLRLRYRQTALGVLWVLAQPIAGVAAFTLVFDHLADVGSQGVPYPLFALVGLVTWTYFASAVTRAGDVLVGNPALVTKVYFPRVAAPLASVLPRLVDLAVTLVLLAGLLVVTGTLTLNGSSDYKGLILVLGQGKVIRRGGGGDTSLGAIAVARFDDVSDEFLQPYFDSNGGGNSAIRFDAEWVRKALGTTGPGVLAISEY